MKLKTSAILATMALINLSLSAQAKKKGKPAAPAKPAVAAPAVPEAPAAPSMPAAPAAEPAADAPAEGFFVKSIKGGDGKDITLKLGGYVDAYYAYHTRGDSDFRPGATHPAGTADASATNIGSGAANTGRVFESPGQQFSLGLIQTKFEMGNEDWQVVADLIHGPNAEQTNFNNLRGATSSTTSTAIKQAYVSGKLMKGLKLTAGQWSTHVGYEVVESYQNANYTLNYLFGYGPFYHTGAKLDYEVSDKIAVMAGVVNGWDLQYDNNKDKSAIAQIALKPTSALNIFINYVGGNETTGRPGTTDNNVGGMRHIGDLVVTYQLSKMIKLGMNVVYGQNKVNTATPAGAWGGAALYVSLTPVDGFTLSYRGEYYDDKQQARGLLGVTGGTSNGADVIGNTLTATISMYGGHFLIRPEVKYDVANKEVFGGGGSELKKDNITALIAFTGVY